jgi:exonuclease VII small subunit
MKIDDYYQIIKNLYPGNKSDPQHAVGGKFGDILKETIGDRKQEVVGPRQTTFVNPLAGIQQAAPFEAHQQATLDRLENLINLLDQYREKLSDPRITLKTIDPLIKEIDQQKENLAPVLDSLPDGEKLKDIVNKTLVTASLEVTKFYRGDFIAS